MRKNRKISAFSELKFKCKDILDILDILAFFFFLIYLKHIHVAAKDFIKQSECGEDCSNFSK